MTDFEIVIDRVTKIMIAQEECKDTDDYEVNVANNIDKAIKLLQEYKKDYER